jgi:hypothetical protein
VSRNALSLIRLSTIEREALGQWPPQLPQPIERSFPLPIAAYFELAGPGDVDLDLVAFFQVERLNDGRWQPDG